MVTMVESESKPGYRYYKDRQEMIEKNITISQSIAFKPELLAKIDEIVEKGRYASRSELIRIATIEYMEKVQGEIEYLEKCRLEYNSKSKE